MSAATREGNIVIRRTWQTNLSISRPIQLRSLRFRCNLELLKWLLERGIDHFSKLDKPFLLENSSTCLQNQMIVV